MICVVGFCLTTAKDILPLNLKLRLLYRGEGAAFVLASTTLGSALALLKDSKTLTPCSLVTCVSVSSARTESAMAFALRGPVMNNLCHIAIGDTIQL